MKQLFICTVLALSPIVNVSAQLPNSNCENWALDANGKDSLVGWSSSNSVVIHPVVSLYKETQPFQGNYGIHLSTAPFGWVGYSTVGVLVNGNATFFYGGGGGNNSVELQSGGGTPISYKPNELKGYYMTPTTGTSDLPLAKVLMSKYNSTTNQRDTVSYTEFLFPTNTSYSAFSIPLLDLMPGVIPDSITTVFYSSNPSTVSPNGVFADFYLDSLELPIINSTGTDKQTACGEYTWIDGITYTSDNNSATYTLPNSVGGDSIVTLDLTINNVNTDVTQMGIVLTADEIGAIYQWVNCPGMTPINGANNQTYTAASDGDFAVIVTKNGCTDTSRCVSVVTLGVSDIEFNNDVLIYPNPTNSYFTVELGEITGINSYTIRTIEGRIVQMSDITDNIFTIDLEAERSGVFYLTIISDNKTSTYKIIRR